MSQHAGPDQPGAGRAAPPTPPPDDPGRVAPVERFEERAIVKPARTSAAAAVGLALGSAALVCVLTVVLSPVGLVLGVLGLLLAIVGIRRSSRPGITGRGVAIGALAVSLLAAILAVLLLLGVSTVLNDPDVADWVEQQVQDWQDRMSDSTVSVP